MYVHVCIENATRLRMLLTSLPFPDLTGYGTEGLIKTAGMGMFDTKELLVLYVLADSNVVLSCLPVQFCVCFDW